MSKEDAEMIVRGLSKKGFDVKLSKKDMVMQACICRFVNWVSLPNVLEVAVKTIGIIEEFNKQRRGGNLK